jgi:predicted nucleic acid-binding protein
MEETRGITVKVAESLHGKAKQEAEENELTMSQLIEKVLDFYFNREDRKEMNGNRRTLAFQVSEEFFAKVQEYIKAHGIRLKDFGITAMRKAMEDTAPTSDVPAEDAAPDTDTDAPDNQETA